MGTITVSRWIPTDSYTAFTFEVYVDLEDPDDSDVWEESRNIATETEPSDARKEAIDQTLRRRIRDRAYEILNDSDFDSSEFEFLKTQITWRRKDIEICEWCQSSTCPGDPDSCEQVPDWCDGCSSYTGGECDCVWCAHCNMWNYSECEHDNSGADVEVILELLNPVVVVEEEAEEETVL